MKNRIITILTILSLSPVTAFADEFGSGGWSQHMGFMGEGWGGHMGFMGGGWLMMILWIGLLIFAIVGITRWVARPGRKVIATVDAHNILRERFAKGEISKEQFEEMQKLM
ncbi:SHOCT domain-containing protein [bacterium]|nr:SHOCT domain-containing protein [bacterium]